MRSKVGLLFLAGVAAIRAQNGCIGQLTPLKPLTPLGCTDTKPVCVCEGEGCHIVYACSGGSASESSAGTAWQIPLSGQSAPTKNPYEAFAEGQANAQKLRNIRLQNELLQQQLRNAQRAAQSPQVEAGGTSLGDGWTLLPKAPAAPSQTRGIMNGGAWRTLRMDQKIMYLAGFRESLAWAASGELETYVPPASFGETVADVDRFYSEAKNVLIPMPVALTFVTMRSRGKAESEIETLLTDARSAAAEASKH